MRAGRENLPGLARAKHSGSAQSSSGFPACKKMAGQGGYVGTPSPIFQLISQLAMTQAVVLSLLSLTSDHSALFGRFLSKLVRDRCGTKKSGSKSRI